MSFVPVYILSFPVLEMLFSILLTWSSSFYKMAQNSPPTFLIICPKVNHFLCLNSLFLCGLFQVCVISMYFLLDCRCPEDRVWILLILASLVFSTVFGIDVLSGSCLLNWTKWDCKLCEHLPFMNTWMGI